MVRREPHAARRPGPAPRGPAEQAALQVHETIYYLNRETTGANRSMTSRELTGILFADTFDVERFNILADRELPTINQRHNGDPIEIELINKGKLMMQVNRFVYDLTIDIAGKKPEHLTSYYDRDTINIDSSDTPFLKVTINQKGANEICFYQNNILFNKILNVHSKYKLKKDGCFRQYAGTTFLFVPPKNSN